MGVIQRVKKPSTSRGKKFLLSREPKVIEDAKKVMFIRGKKTRDIVISCMRDLHSLKKPDTVMLNKKNEIIPFENAVPIEQFSQKLNAPLFVFGSTNKKRPNCLILGRTFNHQLLDMIEFSIEKFKSIHDFGCEKIASGIKPCLIFAGEGFDLKPELMRLKNLFVDLFQREEVSAIRLQGIEHALMFTNVEDKIYIRSYRILLKKSGTDRPNVELEEIGPSIDLKVQRTKLASDDLFIRACKKPKELKIKKTKNISRDVFGTKKGRIHVPRQGISNLRVKKMKVLRSKKSGKRAKKQKGSSEAGNA